MNLADFEQVTEGVILIVDDIPTNLEVLLDVLFDYGFEVLVALDGESAIEQVEYAHPDIILLDVMMPGIDGFETCRRLKMNAKTKEIPVIFMTALTETVDKLKGLHEVRHDYITKPLQHEEVLARITTHLTLKKLQLQLQQANLELERANDDLEQRVQERTQELVKLNSALERFVPREFLSFLGKNSIVDIELGDQVQKEMTILFSDIRGFTTLSEQLTPQENFNFLNSYLQRVSPIIRKYHGFIDKYLGDGIMALFPGSVDHAIQAAIAMQQEVESYNNHREQSSYTPIHIRCSIHTGSLMLGMIGEEERIQGTVISDAVNLAFRLDSVSKMYGVRIVISAQTLNNLLNPEKYNYRFVDKVKVKGKKQAISVYEIFDGDPEPIKLLKQESKQPFEEGIIYYHEREFAHAIRIFETILQKNPVDQSARLHLKRAQDFMLHGVPPGWAGVEQMYKEG